MSESYTISADGKAITCHRCGLVSYHPMDIATKYCGNCHVFHDALASHDARSADSLLNEVARLQAQLRLALLALDQIDRHVVGACASDFGDMPEPCEECGEMREIASQALNEMKKA